MWSVPAVWSSNKWCEIVIVDYKTVAWIKNKKVWSVMALVLHQSCHWTQQMWYGTLVVSTAEESNLIQVCVAAVAWIVTAMRKAVVVNKCADYLILLALCHTLAYWCHESPEAEVIIGVTLPLSALNAVLNVALNPARSLYK